MTGCALRPSRAVVVAVTGAACAVRVDGRPAAWGAPVRVPAGALLDVGAATCGLRGYVAFAGGVDVPPVLGSRSTDLLSGLGPAPLSDGDELPLGQDRSASAGAGGRGRAAVRRPGARVGAAAARRGRGTTGSPRRRCAPWSPAATPSPPPPTGSGCGRSARRSSGPATANCPARAWCSARSRCRRTACPWCSWPTIRPPGATR